MPGDPRFRNLLIHNEVNGDYLDDTDVIEYKMEDEDNE